jgi:hypothetical protein
MLRVAVPLVLVVELAIGVVAVLDRQSSDSKAAERRGLLSRGEQLTATALAPGSALACLDSGAGEAAETACEAAVFASAGSTAAAVAYVGARLSLLTEAKALDPAVDSFPTSRRAVELDRYGIAAHVLATRDGCTPERCAAFAHLSDANALKANMKAQAFDQYVSRHASAWNAPPATPGEPAPAVVSAAPSAPVQSAAVSGPPVAQPMSDKYTLPSAASIPAVSIMNAEPPLPKGADAAQFKTDGRPEARPADAKAEDDVPMPPKRPQARAEPAAPALPLR